MTRSWGVVTLGAAAVPVFGDVLTAAFVVPGAGGVGTVQVGSTTRYRVGDRIILGIGQAGANVVLVQGITDATHLAVKSEGGAALNAWVNGTIIALADACYEYTIQGVDGNTGTQWLGTDNTVTNAGGGTAVYQLAKVAAAAQPNSKTYYTSQGSNSKNTDEKWIVGTTGDKYVASFDVN